MIAALAAISLAYLGFCWWIGVTYSEFYGWVAAVTFVSSAVITSLLTRLLLWVTR